MIYLETFKIQFKSIFKNYGLMILMFIGPIFLIYFMGGVYYNDYVNDIPIAILDEDNTALSRMMKEYFVTDERFQVTEYPTSREELEALIDLGEVHAGLWIPSGMQKGATTFKSSEVLFIVDGTNLVVANNAYAQATMIIQTISAGVEMKLIEGKGLTPQISGQIARVYNIGERVMFDPKLKYMNYLIISFLAVFLQQLYLSSIGSMLIRDHKRLANGHVIQKVLATSASIVVGFIPATLICMVTLVKLYDVPIRGNLWAVVLMTLIFLTALTGPALILASITKDRVTYSQFSLMLSLPTFVASGAVWPVEQMPKVLEIIVRLTWPLINYGKLAQEILIKDRDFMTVLPNLAQIVIYGLVYITIGIICYKKAFTNKNVAIEDVEVPLVEGASH